MKLRLPFCKIARKRSLCRAWLLNVCLCLGLSSILNRNAVTPYSPGLAASTTLGSLAKELFNRKAVAPFLGESKSAQPPCGWDSTNLLPRVGEAVNLGCRHGPR